VNKGMGDDNRDHHGRRPRWRVRAPLDITQRVAFLSSVENLQVEPGMASAKVIINSRTGTVVISSNVIVTPAAVSHGSLSVTIKEEQTVSSTGAVFQAGTNRGAQQLGPSRWIRGRTACSCSNPAWELEQIVRAVNDVGAAPGDLVSHSRSLREAGACRAELIVDLMTNSLTPLAGSLSALSPSPVDTSAATT